MARLIGRLRHGLTPWRRRGVRRWVLPVPGKLSLWHEQWEAPDRTLGNLRRRLAESGSVVTAGGDYDAWDLRVRGGLLGSARVLMATEEHGAGRQLLRFRVWPSWSVLGVFAAVLFAAISVAAFSDGALFVGVWSALGTVLVVARAITDSGFAIACVADTLGQLNNS